MSEVFRWWIEGTLTTRSPLRIGDGGICETRVPIPKDGGPIDVSTVFTDVDGQAYIPGSTIKGILRAALGGETADHSLFGYQEKDSDVGNGGEVEFWDARLTKPSEGLFAPFFDPKRGTAVSAHTTIDRRTKTPAENKLFYFEYVPVGAEFTVRLSANSLSDSQAGTLLAALALFQDTDLAPRLGANTPDGWGTVEWQPTSIRRMGAAEVAKWLNAPSAPLTDFQVTITPASLPAPAGLAQSKDFVEFPLHIQMTSFFLVNDTARARRQKSTSDAANITPLKTPEGAPHLPASSLRGALRSQAERIYRTMHPEEYKVEYKTVSPRGGDTKLPSVRRPEDLPNLDLVCRLFGAPGWRSPISFQTVATVEPGQPQTQDFVAIDRFTGGGADQLKFDADSFYRPSFGTTLRVDFAFFKRVFPNEDQQKEAWLLLGLTLRDLAQGDITLGYGAAKGYGACEANITVLDPQTHLPDDLKARFAAGFQPAEELIRANPVPSKDMGTVKADPDQFFNPYQFVPVTAPDTQGAIITTADLVVGKLGRATHDHYVGDTHSGRILCTLTSETPMFVGAKRDADVKPAKLEHYHLPGSDQPAIPASSLRGLISSIAESTSRSALRVLQNPEVYSYRNPAAATGELDKIPTAIGMVVRRLGPGNKPQLYIKPLCLPTFKQGEAAHALSRYRPYFPEPVVKTYIGMRGKTAPLQDIASPAFETANPNWKPGSAALQPLAPLSWNNVLGSGGDIRLSTGGGVVLEQRVSTNPKDPKVPGVSRMLGCSETRDIAGSKTHELFIRFPLAATFQPDTDELADPKELLVVLPDNVVNRFNRLADEMTDQWREDEKDVRPYEPRGTRPDRRSGDDPNQRKLRIVPGDLVYFRLETGRVTLVAEISFSSIWRKEIPKDGSSPARCHDFFAQISPDLLPLGPQRVKGRASVPLTPAELLFGFVEDQSTPEGVAKPDRPAFALAGCLRFSAGIATGPTSRLPETTLRILSSPKPPSPSMYFQRATPDKLEGDYIAKSVLKLDKKFQVRGRKFYLHHAAAFTGATPWRSGETENAAQKVSIRPVDRGAAFQFHLDFDNISPEELNLLLYSLRPSPAFRHKLGLGKPLGLGSVRIDIDGLYAIQRAERYSEASFLESSPRWTLQPVAPSALAQPALERIGTTQVQAVAYPMVYVLRGEGQSKPQEKVQGFGESQHYPWFVANDIGCGKPLPAAKQALTPLRGDSPKLEPLNRLDYRPPK